MKLIQLKVTNFRCYREETVLDLDDLTVLIGKNDAGKSSLFDAMEIFFSEKQLPDKEDFCVFSESSTMRIACVFDDFPDKLVIDSQNETRLVDEYLLNGEVNDEAFLEIVKIFDFNSGNPKDEGIYSCSFHPIEENYNDLLTLTITQLRKRAKDLEIDMKDINEAKSAAIRKAIWDNAINLKKEKQDISLKGAGAKDIWNSLKEYMPEFALFKSDRESTDQDSEAQDPMKVAVKQAIMSEREKLDKIASNVQSEVERIAYKTIEKMEEMNSELTDQLNPEFANPKWDTFFKVNLVSKDGIAVNKRGTGTRRLILLNFFRVQAEERSNEKATGLIYAIEEPETGQHPNSQMMLIRAFEDISKKEDSQVFFSTHNPNLARKLPQDCLRFISPKDGKIEVDHGKDEETMHKIVNSLGVLPDHSVKAFFAVEGKNDVSFFKIISKMLNEFDNSIPDLDVAEKEGKLIIITMGGSNLEFWVSRFNNLHIPTFYFVDGDLKEKNDDEIIRDFETSHDSEGKQEIGKTSKREIENYIHLDAIKSVCPEYKEECADSDDVPELFAKALHDASESENSWEEIKKDLKKYGKKISNAKKRLNCEVVSKMTFEQLSEIDASNELSKWLKKIGKEIQR